MTAATRGRHPGISPLAGSRVALLCDFREEGWTSMDIVADRLAETLPSYADVTALRPDYRRLSAFPANPGIGKYIRNAERFLNRAVVYPRFLRRLHSPYDLYHILDHSYAHLALDLPPHRTVIYCHDLDAFRCVIEPHKDLRPRWFRHMSRRLLDGFRRVAFVICGSAIIREELVLHGLMPLERTTVIPYGIDPGFTAAHDDQLSNQTVLALLREAQTSPYILNVGSTIPRKRIELLLDIFAAARCLMPDLKLVRVGGPLTDKQQAIAERLSVAPHIISLTNVPTPVLAALYRKALATVQPTASEGFGLPMVEALACGCPVIATDLPVLREVAGEAALFESTCDPNQWAAKIALVPEGPGRRYLRETGLERARSFSWDQAAQKIASVYEDCLFRASLLTSSI